MGVDPTSPDDIATRRWQLDVSASREQRRRKQDGGANPSAERRVELGRLDRSGMNMQRIPVAPFGMDPDGLDQMHQRLDIPDHAGRS